MSRLCGRMQRRDSIAQAFTDNLKRQIIFFQFIAEIGRQMCRARNLCCITPCRVNLSQPGIYLKEHAYSRCPWCLSTFLILQGQLQVKILAAAFCFLNTFKRRGRQRHHGNARRTSQGFLAACNHNAGIQCCHVERVAKECADRIYD